MGPDNLIDMTKEYLSDARYTIKLDDLVGQQIREILLQTSEDNFALDIAWSIEEFTHRLEEYQRILDDLLRVSSLVAFWGKRDHLPILSRALERLTDPLVDPEAEKGVWNVLRWYPVLLLLYSTGISALARKNYDNLALILLTSSSKHSYSVPAKLVLATQELVLQDYFKTLPDREHELFPRSEYLFELLRPILSDLLCLGLDYENCFDRFEVLRALVYADLAGRKGGFWFPLGRFAYKVAHMDISLLKEILDEADREKDSWGPIKAGLFSGDYLRFKALGDGLIEFINKSSLF